MSNGVNFKDICIDLRGKLDRVTAERNALQADLAAKDQRVDELEWVLMAIRSRSGDSTLIAQIDAALNPTPKPHTCCGSCQAGCIGAKP